MVKRLTVVLLLLAAGWQSQSQIRLPQLLRDSMILQRDQPVRLWGWASPKEKITVSFNRKTIRTRAGSDGKWKLELPATKAGGPYSIQFQGKNSITLNDVLFGDVWFCSGQSNMVHQLNIHDVTYADEIATANFPQIRQFWIPTATSLEEQKDDITAGHWAPAVGEAVRPFSAVAYFMAKKLHHQYGVPIGIINASVGGTPIEAWTGGLQSPQANATPARPDNPVKRPSPPVDKGMSEPLKWYDPAYVPKGWRSIFVPGYWEDQGIKELNGVVWYRKEIMVPESMTGKPGRMFLGRIVDMDEVYINGKKIGQTTYLYPQRRYAIPQDVLQPGKNLIVVRVTNHNGKGGFVPDKPYYLFSSKDTVELTGKWEYKVGAAFEPVSSFYSAGGNDQNKPSALYNAMVAPVTSYTIKGFCWYQGETNAGRPMEYAALSRQLINQWRGAWNLGNLPFLYVQLPGFMEYNYLPSESNWAVLREAQASVLEVPNTAMAVAIDLGEWNDVHPDNKKEVGDRLALAAMKLAYGEQIVYSGPLFRTARVEGNKIIVEFDHTGGGLITNDGEAPGNFAIAGADKKFVWAAARIEGNTVVVSSDRVSNPMYVRYAWADNPTQANLYNREGLPASPFRTDR